jgi:hypothetical protein
MAHPDRRKFLRDVGKGMLLASVGPALAGDLGLASAHGVDADKRLTFGAREPLVSLMEETPADKLLPVVVEKLKSGTSLDALVGAATLANARAFGGQDYTGFHTFMALAPSYHMALELPDDRRALPVLKVLHRNARRIHETDGCKHEVLHPLEAEDLPKERANGEALREAVRKIDAAGAERIIATMARGPIGEAYNHLQFSIQDEIDVHRVVLAWRSWVTFDLLGKEHASTLLRQSVRFCLDEERNNRKYNRTPEIRTVLPKMLDQYRLVGRSLGTRVPDDAALEQLAMTIYSGTRAQAADAAAQALAEGISADAVGEAISVAANRLVLCDPGRRKAYPGKPEGSVHGDSVGVHASDSANAWRNIARVSNQRNTVASLITGAFHTAGQSSGLLKDPYPSRELQEQITAKDAATLLKQTEAAIRDKDQARASVLVHRYGQLGFAVRPVFDLLLKYALSEDGALHAEKYYRTVCEEFAATRPAFRWRQLVALARVTTSEYGFPAPGYMDACRLLKV